MSFKSEVNAWGRLVQQFESVGLPFPFATSTHVTVAASKTSKLHFPRRRTALLCSARLDKPFPLHEMEWEGISRRFCPTCVTKLSQTRRRTKFKDTAEKVREFWDAEQGLRDALGHGDSQRPVVELFTQELSRSGHSRETLLRIHRAHARLMAAGKGGGGYELVRGTSQVRDLVRGTSQVRDLYKSTPEGEELADALNEVSLALTKISHGLYHAHMRSDLMGAAALSANAEDGWFDPDQPVVVLGVPTHRVGESLDRVRYYRISSEIVLATGVGGSGEGSVFSDGKYTLADLPLLRTLDGVFRDVRPPSEAWSDDAPMSRKATWKAIESAAME